MKTKSILLFASALTAVATALHAGPRTSANYSILTDTIDGGGKRATSTEYTNDGSVGGIVGIATVAVPAETAKSGYIGQLYETTGLVLNATPLTVNEGGTLQLAAWQSLDDATFLAVPATDVTWSVVSGPLTSINASGLATAGIVYQNTAASAQGIYLGNTIPPLALTVLNVNRDDFGLYASDGIDDKWQVDYFGQNNTQALPGANPDGDALNNLGEWGFGLNPTVGSGGVLVVSGGQLTGRGLPDTRVTNITNGVDFRAVFGRRKDYQLFGLTYKVQFSDAALTVWESSTATPTVIATNDPEIDAVTVPYPFFLTSTGRKAQYFKVTVSHP